MSALRELDPNAAVRRRTPNWKQTRLAFSGKHARVSSDEDDYTSGPESTRVHPPSTQEPDGDEKPLKKRLRQTRPAEREADDSSDDEVTPRSLLPSQRITHSQCTAATMHRRMARAPAFGMPSLNHAKIDYSSWMRTYVSHDSWDVFRIASEQEHRTWAPPFACAFSNAARAGGKAMLAVSDEEGGVCFIDGSSTSTDDRQRGRVTMKAHENAIFDVRWSADDSVIATASGDQTVGITDVVTQKAVTRLVGHLSSVKQAVWDPSSPKVLATASRDGSIRIWDIRESNEGFGSHTNLIRNAHALPGKGLSLNRTPRSAPRSVTALAYLPQRTGLIASAGTADGIVKLWDLRKTHTKRANPVPVASSDDLTCGRGIATLALSGHHDRLHALGVDATLYTLDAMALAYNERVVPGARRSDCANTFYVHLSPSPCGRWLVSGSSRDDALIWDTEAPAFVEPIRLSGHSGEVGAVDWAHDTIATCGDDLQVRLWRPNVGVFRRAQHDADLRKWHWSGSWEKPARTT